MAESSQSDINRSLLSIQDPAQAQGETRAEIGFLHLNHSKQVA